VEFLDALERAGIVVMPEGLVGGRRRRREVVKDLPQ
jgi:hypothetical protein